MGIPRENGYYWVSNDGKHWQIAEWEFDLWYRMGTSVTAKPILRPDGTYLEWKFIDPKPIKRIPTVNN